MPCRILTKTNFRKPNKQRFTIRWSRDLAGIRRLNAETGLWNVDARKICGLSNVDAKIAWRRTIRFYHLRRRHESQPDAMFSLLICRVLMVFQFLTLSLILIIVEAIFATIVFCFCCTDMYCSHGLRYFVFEFLNQWLCMKIVLD
jgi:hypothetical protein